MNLRDLLPDFFVIGAAKSGTTTLFDVLKQHPSIEMSLVKEPRFFSDDLKYANGLDWYVKTFFHPERKAALRGDASPHYLYWSARTVPRLREAYPDSRVKFIAIFREPVQRAYSHYWHAYRYGWDEATFEEAVRDEETRADEYLREHPGTDEMRYPYLKVSMYATQLKPFLDHFPREQFLFLLQDDLSRDFAGTIRRMFEFLQVDSLIDISSVVSNPATLPRSRSLLTWLKTPAPPGSIKNYLKPLLPLAFRMRAKKVVRKANQKLTRYPPMDPIMNAQLKERYVGEIQELEKMIGRDLSHWMGK